jgi:hypothetical protein
LNGGERGFSPPPGPESAAVAAPLYFTLRVFHIFTDSQRLLDTYLLVLIPQLFDKHKQKNMAKRTKSQTEKHSVHKQKNIATVKKWRWHKHKQKYIEKCLDNWYRITNTNFTKFLFVFDRLR